MAAVTDQAERRFVLTLQYDGSAFYGWQSQPDVPTVQDAVDGVLSTLFDRPTRSAAAGRTDRGVHATGQVITCDGPARWEPDELLRAMNALLPETVLATRAAVASPHFHARFSATGRAYRYRVGVDARCRSPFLNRVCWPLGEALDRVPLDACAARVLGEHSFASFAKAGQEERGDRCEVRVAEWDAWGSLGFILRIEADRFLHHMVRYLVGTMVEVARGARPLEEFAGLLEGDEGLVTSPPAPAGGLFLTHVYYGSDVALEDPESARDGGLADSTLAFHGRLETP